MRSSVVTNSHHHRGGVGKLLGHVLANRRTYVNAGNSIFGAAKRAAAYSKAVKHEGRPKSKPKLKTTGDPAREAGATTRVAASKRKRTAVSKPKGGKHVKPTKRFKELVVACNSAKDIHGRMHEVYSGSLITNGNLNQQGVGLSMTNFTQYDFTPELFLDAASVLFNNKVYSVTAKGLVNPANIGYSTSTVTGADYASSAVLTVKNSYVTYLLRNNTGRTITVDILLCAPKMAGMSGTNNIAINGAAAATQPTSIGDPLSYWRNCIFDDITDGRNVAAISNQQAAVEVLYTRPSMTASFARVFKTETTTIVLEPGQTYEYSYQGPKGLEIDFSKLFQHQCFMDIQKYSRFPIFITRMDMIGSTGTNVAFGRLGEVTSSANGIFVEKKVHYDIKMPEETGGITQAQGKSATLGFRRPAYALFVNNPLVVAGQPYRYDEENPIAPANPA